MITNCIDTERELLKYVPDVSLPKFFLLSKTFYFKICDDNFLKRRLMKYDNIYQYKKKNETWKCFYSRTVFSIHKMKENFNVNYYQGNFENQLTVLKKFKQLSVLFEVEAENSLAFANTIFKALIIVCRIFWIIFYDLELQNENTGWSKARNFYFSNNY